MEADKKRRTIAFLTGVAAGAFAMYSLITRQRDNPPKRASLALRGIQLFFRLKGKGLSGNPETHRNRYLRRTYPSHAPIPRSLRQRCDIWEDQIQGQPVFTVKPKAGNCPVNIIYTHGGGYLHPLVSFHWDVIRQLIDKTGATVTIPIYPLTPEYNYKTTYALLEEVYRRVLKTTAANQVILCGDSAGGGLAIGQALYYRDLGLALPGRVILFAPWLDITMSNPGASAVEKDDVILSLAALIQAGQWWAGGDDPRLPLLSPIFGDLSGLPPIDVFQGTADVFIADVREFAARGNAAGSEIRLYEYTDAFHAFICATFTFEAQDTFQKVAASVAILS